MIKPVVNNYNVCLTSDGSSHVLSPDSVFSEGV